MLILNNNLEYKDNNKVKLNYLLKKLKLNYNNWQRKQDKWELKDNNKMLDKDKKIELDMLNKCYKLKEFKKNLEWKDKFN